MTKKISTRTAFTLSILLNLFLVGMVGAMMLYRPHHGSWRSATQEMSPETRHLMARAFQRSRHDMGAEISKMQKAKKELAKILAAEEFDAGAYDKALGQLREAQTIMRMRRAEAIKELAAQLPQDERKILAEGFSRPFSSAGGRDFIGPHREEKYAEPKQLWPQPFKEKGDRKAQADDVVVPMPSAKPALEIGPYQEESADEAHAYGPALQMSKKTESKAGEAIFDFGSLKLEPPREPANH